jgi:hypothetical protein
VCVSNIIIQKPQQLGDLGPSWAPAPPGGKKDLTYVVEIVLVNDIGIFVCSRCAQYVKVTLKQAYVALRGPGG